MAAGRSPTSRARARIGGRPPHRQLSPASASGTAVTSPDSSDIVASPQAYGSSGSAAASATPAARPTEVSTALETTTGSPQARATRSAPRTPPSGATLITTMSAAPAALNRQRVLAPCGSTHRPRSGYRQVDAARRAHPGWRTAARRTPGRTRQPPQHPRRGRHRPAAVGVDPDRARRAERVADRRDALDVLRLGLALLGHLDLRGPAAGRRDDLRAPVPADGGHRHVDRDRSRDRSGPGPRRRLDRAGQPPRRLARAVLGERGELPPPGRALDQRALPDGDAAEPRPHRDRERPQRPGSQRCTVRRRRHSAHGRRGNFARSRGARFSSDRRRGPPGPPRSCRRASSRRRRTAACRRRRR